MLGRLQKNHWSTMTTCMQRIRKPQWTIALACKITFKQIVEVSFQWNNKHGTKGLEQNWNNLFEHNFACFGTLG